MEDLVEEQGVRQYEERLRPPSGHRGKGAFELLGALDFVDLKRHIECPSRCLRFV
jgi:hypothetical protein